MTTPDKGSEDRKRETETGREGRTAAAAGKGSFNLALASLLSVSIGEGASEEGGALIGEEWE